MNRIATTLTTLTASAFLCQTLGAAEPTMEALNSRINALESRITTLEAVMKSDSSSYSYSNAAVLEATKSSQASATSATNGTYVIQDGDTLGKIAEKFKIERKSLLEANRLSEGQPIYIGETLMIPGAAPAPAPTPDANMAEAGKPVEARKDSVVIGETKKPETTPVPAPAPVATRTHKIVKGDTLTSVGKKYGTSVESIKSANGLRSDTISLGQTLKIPSTQTASIETESAPETKQEQTSAFQYDNELLRAEETYGYYTVNKGDNLYALARDFFTTMSELQRINRLGASTTIFPGSEIIVPTAKYNAYHKTGETGEMVNR
jgi:D-gamma-glutamyl-meso-diaminopimelic acid endopeptidase CwlS